MDVWKFRDLLERKALYFCRADKFEDPLEGTISKEGIHGTSASDLAFAEIIGVTEGDMQVKQPTVNLQSDAHS
jgi:hypothetical protein